MPHQQATSSSRGASHTAGMLTGCVFCPCCLRFDLNPYLVHLDPVVLEESQQELVAQQHRLLEHLASRAAIPSHVRRVLLRIYSAGQGPQRRATACLDVGLWPAQLEHVAHEEIADLPCGLDAAPIQLGLDIS